MNNMLQLPVFFLLRLRKAHNALQLHVFFFFSFFCQPYQGLRNCKSVFLILKVSQYGGSEAVSPAFFQGIHVRTDIRIDVSISIWRMITKFGKQVHLQDTRQMRLVKQVLATYVQITWQTKKISLLPQCLWSPNLASWWLAMRGFHPQ